MSQADLLVTLLQTASSGDQQEFNRAAQNLIDRERSKGHRVLAERLEKTLLHGLMCANEHHYRPAYSNLPRSNTE